MDWKKRNKQTRQIEEKGIGTWIDKTYTMRQDEMNGDKTTMQLDGCIDKLTD